jgi:rRNA processing protein Krr1/Pno1
MMGKLIGYSILKVDHPVAIMGVFERFNEARRKLEELSKNGGKYRIQEEWIGEPASVINKQR